MAAATGRPRSQRARSELIRLRRRDLNQDLAAGSLLALLGLIWAAGLGVLALIAAALAVALMGTSVLARHRRRRGTPSARRSTRSSPSAGRG